MKIEPLVFVEYWWQISIVEYVFGICFFLFTFDDTIPSSPSGVLYLYSISFQIFVIVIITHIDERPTACRAFLLVFWHDIHYVYYMNMIYIIIGRYCYQQKYTKPTCETKRTIYFIFWSAIIRNISYTVTLNND